MPKIRESPQQVFYDRLTRDIIGQMFVMDITQKELADRICIHHNTLSKRLNHPDTWIMWELVAVAKILKLELGGLCAAK